MQGMGTVDDEVQLIHTQPPGHRLPPPVPPLAHHNSPPVAQALKDAAMRLQWPSLPQQLIVVEGVVPQLTLGDYTALRSLLTPLCAATHNGNAFQLKDWEEHAPARVQAAAARIESGKGSSHDAVVAHGGEVLDRIKAALNDAFVSHLKQLGLQIRNLHGRWNPACKQPYHDQLGELRHMQPQEAVSDSCSS